MSNNGIQQIIQTEYDIFVEKMKQTNEWFAPSMFITTYGKWGVKIEVTAYRYDKDGKMETCGYNVDGANYYNAKKAFWSQWNKDHNYATLAIYKTMSSYGL